MANILSTTHSMFNHLVQAAGNITKAADIYSSVLIPMAELEHTVASEELELKRHSIQAARAKRLAELSS